MPVNKDYRNFMKKAEKINVQENHVFTGQAELAEHLSVTQGAVAKWVREGMPASLQSPGRYLFTWSTVRAWLLQHRPYMADWIRSRGL